MNPETVGTITQWAHLLLEWIGFGTLVGLLAKAIMPGRDPGGPVATILMGIGGCVFGLGTVSYFFPEQRVTTPISVIGFFVATAGAFAILAFYRLLAGYFFVESGDGEFRYQRHARRRRDSSVVVLKD
ncbi:MAG: GlsB/YeaQ/YmgE family stress response membrane protein [Planctomycetes bacterium]|nr:GlsB/YeaQ/YmgE family stress response membrane protein [Planctomycetota bacterium]